MIFNLNENAEAIEILNGTYDKTKVRHTMRVLVLYYNTLYLNEVNKDKKIYDEVNEFMVKHYSKDNKYNTIKDEGFLKGLIEDITKNSKTTFTVQPIPIYKQEIEYITTKLKRTKPRCLAFTMLVYGRILQQKKIQNHKSNENYYIEYDWITDVFKEADCSSYTGERRDFIIADLIEAGVISLTSKVEKITMDNNEYIKPVEKGEYLTCSGKLQINNLLYNEGKEQDVAFTVKLLGNKEIENIGLLLLEYMGDKKIIMCEECGLPVKIGKNGKTKYCKECAKKIKNEKDKERMKKR